MPWARVDDDLHSHPKIIAAWHKDPTSLGLFLLSLSWAAKHHPDGLIGRDFAELYLPNERRRTKAITALVSVGLWELNGEGWQIHDFPEYSRSNASSSLSEVRAQAGRKGAAARWQNA